MVNDTLLPHQWMSSVWWMTRSFHINECLVYGEWHTPSTWISSVWRMTRSCCLASSQQYFSYIHHEKRCTINTSRRWKGVTGIDLCEEAYIATKEKIIYWIGSGNVSLNPWPTIPNKHLLLVYGEWHAPSTWMSNVWWMTRSFHINECLVYGEWPIPSTWISSVWWMIRSFHMNV
jgi:hypothetical protein